MPQISKKKSIKDLAIRVVRNGKTRGRPSKYELTISGLMSHLIEKNRKVIQDVWIDSTIKGTGLLRIKYKKGNIEMTKGDLK